jgi:hypothetical protein
MCTYSKPSLSFEFSDNSQQEQALEELKILPHERFSSLVEDLAGIDHAEVKMGQLVYTAPSPPPALLKKHLKSKITESS